MSLTKPAFWRFLLLFYVAASTLCAQAITGAISGIVTDTSGSVVPGATISVRDIERNTIFKTTSNETGFYVVSPLPPGKYQITAAAPGFRSYLLDQLPISTQQQATVNISLSVGQVAEQLTVTATPQLIESNSSTLSAVVENKRIVDLPLNGRNIFSLTSLVPGVFQTKQTSGVDNTFYGNHFIVNGGQESTSDIILDGVSTEVNHNIPTIPAISAIPSVEGIQEFRIETNAYSAEYGRSGGGVVIMATKSGTNSLHGSAFEFLRNSALDASNFFANSSNTPLSSFKRTSLAQAWAVRCYFRESTTVKITRSFSSTMKERAWLRRRLRAIRFRRLRNGKAISHRRSINQGNSFPFTTHSARAPIPIAPAPVFATYFPVIKFRLHS